MDVQNFDPVNRILEDKFFDIKYFQPDYLFNKVYDTFHTVGPYFFKGENLDGLKFILSLFSIFFITIIAYTTFRILEIRKKEHEHLREEIEAYAHRQAERERNKESGFKNERWAKVLSHVFSSNLSDWKLAIIEADSMLEELLDQLGFKGESLGDKLKSADRDKFKSLTSAWEVHTVRNRIAHEGLNFQISHPEAKRIITLYEQIFREFGFI